GNESRSAGRANLGMWDGVRAGKKMTAPSMVHARCLSGRAGAWGWAGDKLVLHKVRVPPDLVAPRFPPLRRGGSPGTSSHQVFPSALRFESRGSRPTPPGPPFARGGKGSLARAALRGCATPIRVSKLSLPYGQHHPFTSPAWGAGPLFRQGAGIA